MKKLIALMLIFGMIAGIGNGAVWDFMKLFTGDQMIPYGAPWISDDDELYLGDGKDAYLMYDETTDDRLEISGKTNFANPVSYTFYSGVDVADLISTALTTYTSATLKQIIITDSDSANVTVCLPDAATVEGVPITVIMGTAPGSYYTRINATGGDLVNGLAMYGGTGNQYDKVILVSNSSNTYADYYLVDSTGTWATCKD